MTRSCAPCGTPPEYTDERGVFGWLCRAAYTVWIDTVRYNRRRPAVDVDGIDVADDAENIDRDINIWDTYALLQQLPPRYRMVLELVAADYSDKQIAARLHLNAVTFRTLKCRTRAAARDLLGEMDGR